MDRARAEKMVVRREHRDGVLLLTMAEGPANAFSEALLAGLIAGLAEASAPEVQAVVICSGIASFSAGVDTAPPTAKAGKHTLAELCSKVEHLAKPVVAAIEGRALGGGLELALAAHGRVASETARFGCPEVSLGVVPNAGATQRLPRLIGAEAALRMLLEPGPVTAAQALALGLVDQVVMADLVERAVDFALKMAGGGLDRPRKTSDRRDGFRDPKAYMIAIATARKRYNLKHLPAVGRAIDCIEAAQLLLLEQGIAFESAAFEDLSKTRQAKALQYAVAAKQRALMLPMELLGQTLPTLTSISVWGGGPTAADLTVQALARGFWVTLVDPDHDRLVKTLELTAARQDLAISQGRLSEAARDADWARLAPTSDTESLAKTELILKTIESARLPENLDTPVLPIGSLPADAIPGRLALQLAPAAGAPAELGFTEGADVETMALGVVLAQRLGWTLFFAGPGGPVAQRLRDALTAAIAALEAQGFARENISAVLAAFGVGPGAGGGLPSAPAEGKDILDACLSAIANQGALLLSEGVARGAADVDAAAVAMGLFPRWQGGPMFWADERGLLVLRSDLRHRAETAPQIYKPAPIIDKLIADGRNFAALDRAKV